MYIIHIVNRMGGLKYNVRNCVHRVCKPKVFGVRKFSTLPGGDPKSEDDHLRALIYLTVASGVAIAVFGE